MSLASLGTANRIARAAETHPLTWRLRDDGQPVWLDEYQSKQGYDAARKALGQMSLMKSSAPSRMPASRVAAAPASPPA